MRALALMLSTLFGLCVLASAADAAGVSAQDVAPLGGSDSLAGPGEPSASPDESGESKTKQSLSAPTDPDTAPDAAEKAPEPPPESENAVAPEAQAPTQGQGQGQGHDRESLRKVQLRLDAAKQEQADYSTVLPWTTLSLGAATALAALVGGAIHTMSCDGHCDTAPWVAFAAVAGGSLATLGVIWTMHAEADVRELNSQRYQLEQELERVRLSRVSRELMPTRRGSMLSFRFDL